MGLRQFEGVELSLCPVEHLLLLRSGHGLPPAAAVGGPRPNLRDQAEAFLVERVAPRPGQGSPQSPFEHAAGARAVHHPRVQLPGDGVGHSRVKQSEGPRRQCQRHENAEGDQAPATIFSPKDATSRQATIRRGRVDRPGNAQLRRPRDDRPLVGPRGSLRGTTPVSSAWRWK